MATVTTFKIDGQTTTPYRQAEELVINAIFGTEAQPSINLDSIEVTDNGQDLNSTKMRSLWQADPTKGAPFSIGVSNGVDSYDFDFFTDWNKLVFNSEVDTAVGLIKDSSLDQFDERAKGITQQLLSYKGILTGADFTNVPYIVKNRKTDLEKLQLLQQSFNVLKSISDEVHKIINIASDIPTGGAAVALVNLTVTIAAVIQLFNQLFDLFEQIQETFFPPIKYHAGLKPKTFIEKAVVDYMGFDAVDFGNHPAPVSGIPFGDLMNQLVWLGSKNQQKGFPAFIPFQSDFLRDGIFTPSDTGYYLSSCIETLSNEFRLRRAIIDNVLHLKPENDPFWTNQSGYTLPDVKIEQIFANNGTIRPNYNEFYGNTVIQYLTDDSDKWTLDNLIDEEDEDSTGAIISVKIVDSTTATNEKRNIINQGKNVNIPFALAVRNSPIDDLFDIFGESTQLLEDLKQSIKDRLEQFSSQLSQSMPQLNIFIESVENRVGVLKVENDFFSTPKQLLIVENSNGFPTIPIDFADKIGAKALMLNYHSWDSFIQGNRNPNNPQQTAAKYLYEGVKIDFGIKDFSTILNNSYFTTVNGKIGAFTRIAWDVLGDSADVDYWVYEDWMNNIEEDIV